MPVLVFVLKQNKISTESTFLKQKTTVVLHSCSVVGKAWDEVVLQRARVLKHLKDLELMKLAAIIFLVVNAKLHGGGAVYLEDGDDEPFYSHNSVHEVDHKRKKRMTAD